MELAVASQWAEIIGLVTILSAAVYSWIQIRELKKVRQSTAALSLAELFQSPDFSSGLIQLTHQPSNIDSWDKFIEYHGEKWPQALSVMTTWESLGALVHRGDLQFQLVYDLFSGLIMFHHETCQPIIIEDRKSAGDTRFEWFTWLSERIEEYENSQTIVRAAHIEYKDWNPKTK